VSSCVLCPACSFVFVLCLDRQIHFEKELRLARCFGISEFKVLQKFYALDFAESQIPNFRKDSTCMMSVDYRAGHRREMSHEWLGQFWTVLDISLGDL
jgi:hypothetical protein